MYELTEAQLSFRAIDSLTPNFEVLLPSPSQPAKNMKLFKKISVMRWLELLCKLYQIVIVQIHNHPIIFYEVDNKGACQSRQNSLSLADKEFC